MDANKAFEQIVGRALNKWSSELAEEAKKELEKAAEKVMDDFYDDYSPNYYDRTYNLHDAYKAKIESGNKSHKQYYNKHVALDFSTDYMDDVYYHIWYNNHPEIPLKEIVFNLDFVEGLHGGRYLLQPNLVAFGKGSWGLNTIQAYPSPNKAMETKHEEIYNKLFPKYGKKLTEVMDEYIPSAVDEWMHDMMKKGGI